MHREPRGSSSIDKIVVHVNQGPDDEGGARSLGRYLEHIDGGYHEVGDNLEVIVTAPDNVVTWGASGMNRHGWHYCIIGYAQQTLEQWEDPFSHAAVDLAAHRCAFAAGRFGIPLQWLTVDQVATAGVKGLCTHDDVSKAYGGSHWDPGPYFPKERFMAMAVVASNGGPMPGPPPTPEVLRTMFTALRSTPSGKGYWCVKADGAVFSFGDAKYFGGANWVRDDKGNVVMVTLNEPITAMDVHPSGDGYWLLGSDGGVFAYGAAKFFGRPK